MSKFGQKIRELRKSQNRSQRDVAAEVGIHFTYLSRIETDNMDFGDYPGEATIQKLAKALKADEDELLLMAKKIPASVKERVLAQPTAFLKLARLSDKELEVLVAGLDTA